MFEGDNLRRNPNTKRARPECAGTLLGILLQAHGTDTCRQWSKWTIFHSNRCLPADPTVGHNGHLQFQGRYLARAVSSAWTAMQRAGVYCCPWTTPRSPVDPTTRRRYPHPLDELELE